MKKVILTAALIAATTSAGAVTLVQTLDPGYYNNHIGTVLNDTNGGETGPFPVTNDGSYRFATAPDLSAANAALGSWLTDPEHLNLNWSATQVSIPNQWAVGTEVGIIYKFDTLGATNVIAKFGVDNGIFVWLDGKYLFGGRDPGGVVPGEYTEHLGDLASGTHYLELLLEDHGVTNGYSVNITADSYIPAPPPSSSAVPEPAPIGLLGLAVVTLGVGRRRRA